MGPLIPLAVSGISALIGALSKHGQSDPGTDLRTLFQQVPQLRDLTELQTQQAERLDPLHAMLAQYAMNILPRSALGAYAGRPSVQMPQPKPQGPVQMQRNMPSMSDRYV